MLLDVLAEGTHLSRLFAYNPHAFLGIHEDGSREKVIRVFRPEAVEVYIEVLGNIVSMEKTPTPGLFTYRVPQEVTYAEYRVFHTNGLLACDPYAFLPSLGEVDTYLFNKGVHYELYKCMGARVITHQGVVGTRFTVWAPSARKVSLIGDFNYWDGRVNPLRSLGSSGIWELFVPGIIEGEKYKFEIRTSEDTLLIKADPYALFSEVRPKTASIVADTQKFSWEDSDWMENRKNQGLNRPLCIYEVHLGSWKKKDGSMLNYRELAVELALYCKKMSFTHVELLPITEHPFDQSWGYQVTGFFAPTSRFGSCSDFQYFVNYLHKEKIGVIIDWVPGHFPKDAFALSRFDGTALYEHCDPKQGLHPHWDTYIFNFGRKEVANFLLASALFWLDEYHIDGLRVDAVASMLYLDYGREDGNWIPNAYGGKENLDAIEFLKHANAAIHEQYPGVITIAEESTSFRGVSHPLNYNGLGFDLKWNMGWMNDTLTYMEKDPIWRSHHQNNLTFGLLYAFCEKFVLVLSHDEVVHGKRSLLSKMPGDIWQKFANLRLLYSYFICQPGKKLFFMGGEVAQWNEWDAIREIEWGLLEYPLHNGMHRLVEEMNRFYKEHPALWEEDFSFYGFEWVDFSDHSNSVISYLRKSHKNEGEYLLCLHNFTPSYHERYRIPLQNVKNIEELFNTDNNDYGGSGKTFGQKNIAHNGVELSIPPLATTIYRVYFH